jgi:putative addiction module CopG family antidote
MTISFAPELQQFLEEQVRTGKFDSTESALAEAVRLMKQREERLASLQRDIDQGWEDFERGRVSVRSAEDAKARLQKHLEEEGRG